VKQLVCEERKSLIRGQKGRKTRKSALSGDPTRKKKLGKKAPLAGGLRVELGGNKNRHLGPKTGGKEHIP